MSNHAPIHFLLIFSLILSPASARAELTSGLLGAGSSVFVHELGHALTARAMNWKVVEFRPFPSRMPTKSGEKEWVMGYVMSRPPDDMDPQLQHKEEVVLLAMGSGTNVLSVLALAPLLPKTSGYGAEVLDQFLLFSSLNWPAYVMSDIIFQSKGGTGDWRRVSEHTGVSIYWYLAASMVTTAGLIAYLNHHRRDSEEAPLAGLAWKF